MNQSITASGRNGFGIPWTPSEDAIIMSSQSAATADQIASLLPGRSKSAVANRRAKIGAPRTRSQQEPFRRWSDSEDRAIASAPASVTAAQLAASLPGRTRMAVAHRRRTLNSARPNAGYSINPMEVGHRTLVAKTCMSCGHFLAAEKFSVRSRNGWKASECAWCASERSLDWRDRNPEKRQNQDASRRIFKHRMREATVPLAVRAGYEYTESDMVVLADPKMSILEKALTLGRTYEAVSSTCGNLGFISSQPRTSGSKLDAEWVIRNPGTANLLH